MVVTDDVAQRVQARVGSTILEKWRLTRVLGIGGMAAVYAAVHRNQNRVAIKMLHPEQSVNEVVRSRFLREGYVANTVEHPGAVRVFDDGVVDGAAFLVMELLEGESLEDRCDRLGGRLLPAEVLALTDQLLETLATAHDKGIVHRDIKPDNLFLTKEGKLKVLDFGIARLRELSEASTTSAGTFMGTPSFMSPEQARGRWSEVDARSDLWAAGATMFYLLSGRLVHDADSFADQLALAAREPAPPIAAIEPQTPPVISAIIDRALAYRAQDRWPDARSMQSAVRAALLEVGPVVSASIHVQAQSQTRKRGVETKTLLATPDPASPRRERRSSADVVAVTPTLEAAAPRKSRRTWLAFAGALLLLALTGAYWWRQKDEHAAEPSVAVEALQRATSDRAPRAAAGQTEIQHSNALAREMTASAPSAPSASAPPAPSAAAASAPALSSHAVSGEPERSHTPTKSSATAARAAANAATPSSAPSQRAASSANHLLKSAPASARDDLLDKRF